MKKSELIKGIKDATLDDVSQGDIEKVLNVLGEVLVEALKKGEKITIPNVCVISVKDVSERKGVISLGEKAGEEWIVPTHKEPRIKMCKGFKNCLL